MESFDRTPLYLHVYLICSVSVQNNNMPETGTWSPCNALIPVANPRLKDKHSISLVLHLLLWQLNRLDMMPGSVPRSNT